MNETFGLPALPDAPSEELTAHQYQAQQLEAVPSIYKTALERLACELALQMEDPGEIFPRYGYDEDQAIALMESPSFASLLVRVTKDVKESGLSFRMKARMQAEELLGHSFQIAVDPNASTAERVKVIQWTTKVAGLEPKEKEDAGAGRGGFSLNITFSGEAPVKVVAHEPLTITQEI